MAVDRRLSGYSGMRIDWPHLRSIESSVSHDFDMITRGLFTGLNKPYLVRGFRLVIPSSATNASNLQIEVADSVVLHSSATESGTILSVPAGTPNETLNAQNTKVIGAFQANAINYISLDYRRVTDAETIDQTAGWSPSQQLEYQRSVPIGRVLQYRFIISTSGYSTYLPLYAVKTTINGAVDYIVKGVTDLFRLGEGGANPNPQKSYDWGNLTNLQAGADPRREWVSTTLGDNPLTVRPGDNPLAFDYGDFAIKNMKQWMDAVMTRFKEIIGSDFWYLGSGVTGQNLKDLAWDSMNSVMTGAGSLTYNLVLESTPPIDGAFQSDFTDNTILPGDVYVQGVTSGNKASMTSFNESRLLINSMTSSAFVYDEELWTRRKFRPDLNYFKLLDYTFTAGVRRYASLYRKDAGSIPGNISSWSYTMRTSPTAKFKWCEITVNLTAPHTFEVGDTVSVVGLKSTAVVQPDASVRVLSVPSSTSFTFISNFPQSGAATVLVQNGAVLGLDTRHPYSVQLKATGFAAGSGNIGLITVPGHSFVGAQALTADTNNGSNILQNVSDMNNMKVGMLIVAPNLSGGQGYVTRVDKVNSEIEISTTATSTGLSQPITAKQIAFVTGLQATGYTANQLDGIKVIESISTSGQLVVDMGFAVTGTGVTPNATCEYLFHDITMTLTGAIPDTYDTIDTRALAIAGNSVQFDVGTDALPVLGSAGGSIVTDGVVAVSTVKNPVRVSTITNNGSGTLTVNTYTPHGIQAQGPVDFTIFGDSTLSRYIRSYNNVYLAPSGGISSFSLEIDGITPAPVPPASGFPTGQLINTYRVGNNFVLSSSTKLGKIRAIGGTPVGTPTGTVVVDVYASVATIPSGPVLYTSDPVSAASITDNGLIDFSFSGAGFPILPAGNYVWVARGSTTDSLNAATLKSPGSPPPILGTVAVASINSGATWTPAAYSVYYEIYSEITINSTAFTITGTGINSLDSYTNPGTDKTFLQFSDNPYAGPVQWSDDIVIKGVMGDLRFTVPSTATVDMTDPDVSPTADQFNVNGQTGTAYLQDGEVLYIKLKRNKLVSNGTVFSTGGGASTIATASIMTDENGDPLVIGDFIKFSDEPDSRWLRIKTISPTAVTLVSDRGQDPEIAQRPTRTGKMVYARGTYDKVYVKKHYLVETSSDVYWLGVRRDNNGPRSKVYFRSLEIEAGEVRQVNDNTPTNLLLYTGAMTEGAINPNYTVIDQVGEWQAEQPLTVNETDNLTRMVTFAQAPDLEFQLNDQIAYDDGNQLHYFTVRQILTSRTVIMEEDISVLSNGYAVTYKRLNRFIQDTDNLTLAMRKEDRQAGFIDTVIKRPVYDESIYIQQMNVSGAGTIASGSYIYKGSLTNPTALAWVLHGNAATSESIEGATISMPGGHVSIGANAILVNIVYGSFQDGDGLFQNGSPTGRTVNNPGNPPFSAPTVFGDAVTGVEMVLPPNKRTQIKSSTGFEAYGAHSQYKQSADSTLTGEELLVIVNDGVREAGYDYVETFGGPKAKIRLVRTTPPNTRMRFRLMPAYGSAVAAASTDVTLQSAYNGGATIQTTPARPVEITSDDVNAGNAGIVSRGSIHINGGLTQSGGIFNESGDQTFVIGKEADKPKESWTGLEAVKTHSSHAGSAMKTKTAAQVVTGATGTVITSSAITLDDNYAYRIKVKATARRSDGPLGVSSFELDGTFYRSGGGALAAGSPASMINGADGDGVNYAVAFGLSGNDVVAVVYGSAGATVQWVLTIEWQGVGVA